MKKGVGPALLVAVAAGLALILIVAFQYPKIVKLANEILGIKPVEPTIEGTTAGQLLFPPSADESMKALVCAISSMSIGRPGWKPPIICPEGFAELKPPTMPQPAPATAAITGLATNQGPCKGDIAYGSTCVECFESQWGRRLLTLDNDKNKALQQIVEETNACWRKFEAQNKENVHCTTIGIPRGWTSTITKQEYETALTNAGDLGADLSGSGMFELSNIVWQIEDTIGRGPAGPRMFYLCADNRRNPDSIIITRDPESECPIQHQAYEQKQFECRIKSFELPQQISLAEEWIPGYGDPRWITYFEKFPHGEEKAWQLESKTLFMIGLGTQLGLSLIPLAGKGLKAALGPGTDLTRGVNKIAELQKGIETLDTAAREKRLIKIGEELDALKKAGTLSDEGLEALLKSSVKGIYSVPAGEAVDDVAGKLFYKIKSIQNNIPDKELFEVTEELGGITISGRLTPKGQSLLKQDLKKILDDAKLPLSDNQLDDLVNLANGELKEIEDVAKHLATKTNAEEAVASSLKAARTPGEVAALKELFTRVGFKKTIKTLIKQKDLEKAMTKSVKGLKEIRKTNPQLYEEQLKRANTLAESFVDDLGNINFKALLDEPTDDALVALFKTADEAGTITTYGVQVNEFRDLLSGRTWGKGLWRGTVESVTGPFPTGSTWQAAKEITKNQLRGLGCLAPVTKTMLPLCLRFLRDHQFSILVALAYYMQIEESANEKFVPVGTNNFGLASPMNLDAKKIFKAANADKYYVEMLKEDKTRARFFAASPCKADYQIIPSYRGCKLKHEDYFYRFEFPPGIARKQIIEPISGNIKTHFAWDAMTSRDREEYLTSGTYYLWTGEPKWHGFQAARIFLQTDPSLFIKFAELMWPDAESFVVTLEANSKAGAFQAPKAYETFKFVRTLNKEQFIEFRKAFLDWFAEYKTPVFTFNKYGININADSIVFQHVHTAIFSWWLSDSILFNKNLWDERNNCRIGITPPYMPCPWTNPNAPWDEREINWQTFYQQSGLLYDVTRMQATKLFNSQFFDDLMRKSTLVTNEYKGPTDLVVKKCEESLESKEVPTIDNRNRFDEWTTIPTFTIKAAPLDTLYNNGNNYCYSAADLTTQFIGDVLGYASIVGGLALTGFTGNPYVLMVATTADVSAIATSYILEMCGEWPRHAASLKACFS